MKGFIPFTLKNENMKKNQVFLIKIIVLYGFVIFDYFFEKFINSYMLISFNISLPLIYLFLRYLIFGVTSISVIMMISVISKAYRYLLVIIPVISLILSVLSVFCRYSVSDFILILSGMFLSAITLSRKDFNN